MRWPPYHGAPSIESLNGEKGCDTDKGGGERESKKLFVLYFADVVTEFGLKRRQPVLNQLSSISPSQQCYQQQNNFYEHFAVQKL